MTRKHGGKRTREKQKTSKHENEKTAPTKKKTCGSFFCRVQLVTCNSQRCPGESPKKIMAHQLPSVSAWLVEFSFRKILVASHFFNHSPLGNLQEIPVPQVQWPKVKAQWHQKGQDAQADGDGRDRLNLTCRKKRKSQL